MRLGSFFFLLFALAGVSAAQDTNFPVGPQYLITTDSTLFLRPIATPSLSLQPSTSGVRSFPTELATEAQRSVTPAAVQSPGDLSRI